MTTATRANKAGTPTMRSRITSALSDVVMASYPCPSSRCSPDLPTPIEYRLVDRRKMWIGGTDGHQRRTGRAHPPRTGPQEGHRGEDVRRDRLPARREPARRRQEGLAARPARPGAERRGAEGGPRQ